MDTRTFTIELAQRVDYCFEAHFDNPALPALVTDGRRRWVPKALRPARGPAQQLEH
jgi:hypothetical protein